MSSSATGAAPGGGGNRSTQARLRHVNHDAEVNLEGPLVRLSDEDLQAEAEPFAAQLRIPQRDALKALRVAKDIRTYRSIARGHREHNERFERLTDKESRAIVAERDELLSILSKPGMAMIILSVSLAAFLQGHVQVSINCASLYGEHLGIPKNLNPQDPQDIDIGNELRLGTMNAAVFYFAAFLGAPLALPLNYWIGRRGAIAVAAVLIFASSLASSFVSHWLTLLYIRIIGGVGMGLKAVSTPILASETAVRYWRGSSILMWQLWVAFGIMIGGLFNLILVVGAKAENVDQKNPTKTESDNEVERNALRYILGAPMVPAVFLLVALSWCMESPRYYMRRNTPNYNPRRAYDILCHLRKTNLQALRDIFIIHKAIEEEEAEDLNPPEDIESAKLTFANHMSSCVAHTVRQYRELLKTPRLRNALWSSCAVSLCQQLCGINLFAFYSNTFFNHNGASIKQALGYSAAFGAFNFVFGLGAIRTIDTWGRRAWLLRTLPLMCLLLAAAAGAATIVPGDTRTGITAMFIFAFAAVYSPGLGPIPFTLASESFPISQREAGCSIAVASNLFFAGILTNFVPALDSALGSKAGLLGIFSFLNLVAFIIVFLIVEETKEYSLEDLDLVFAVPKRKFVHFQIHDYLLKYFIPKFVLRKKGLKEPQFYNVAMDLNEREQKDTNGEPTAGMTEKAAAGTNAGGEIERQPTNRMGKDRDWSLPMER